MEFYGAFYTGLTTKYYNLSWLPKMQFYSWTGIYYTPINNNSCPEKSPPEKSPPENSPPEKSPLEISPLGKGLGLELGLGVRGRNPSNPNPSNPNPNPSNLNPSSPNPRRDFS